MADTKTAPPEEGLIARLPDDDEFFAAISDSTNVVIRAGGRTLSVYSGALRQQSSVFETELKTFLRGGSGTQFREEHGKAVLDLDCSHDAGHALFEYISSKGASIPGNSASPAMLRELARVANDWKVQPLLDVVDRILAAQTHADLASFSTMDQKKWAYSGGHIRERSIQLLQLALKTRMPRLRGVAEHLIAENWSYLANDERLSNGLLETSSLSRIRRLAAGLHQPANLHPSSLGDRHKKPAAVVNHLARGHKPPGSAAKGSGLKMPDRSPGLPVRTCHSPTVRARMLNNAMDRTYSRSTSKV